jgi:hypothetical protein
MSNDIDTELIACAKTLRGFVNGAEVTVTRRVIINQLSATPALDYNILFGDILNRGPWKWECSSGATLQEAFDAAVAKIQAQGDERAREKAKLQGQAAKIGLKLVEANQQ